MTTALRLAPTLLLALTVAGIGAAAEPAPPSVTPLQPLPKTPTKAVPTKAAPPHTAFEFNGKTYYRSLLPERGLPLAGPGTRIVQTITPSGTVITTVVPIPAPPKEAK